MFENRMDKPRKLKRKEKEALSKQGSSGMINEKKTLVEKEKLIYLLGLFAAVFGFLLYAQTINYSFTLDDHVAIDSNAFVKKGLSGIGSILTTSYHYGNWFSADDLYRPLSLVMFAIEWQFFPNSSVIGHLVNVLLYALTGFLLFKTLCAVMKNNVWVPFCTTLLFLAHPVHTEVVASIKSRDEILCFLLSIASILWLIQFLQTLKRYKLTLSVVSFFFALMAKESAITLLVIIPLLLFVFKDVPVGKGFFRMAPFIIAALFYIGIRAMVLDGIYNTKEVLLYDNVLVIAPDVFTRLATAIYVLGRYLLLLFLPIHLSMDYSYSEITILNFNDYRVLISLVLYLFITSYAIFKIRKKDMMSFGILFYLVTIFLVSNLLIMIGTVMGDRLLYMPSLGFCFFTAVLFARIFKIEDAARSEYKLMSFLKSHSRAFALLGLVLFLYSFKTVTRSPVWKDDLSLHLSGIQDSPNSSRNHHNLAAQILNSQALVEPDLLKRDSLFRVCIQLFQKSAELYPANAEAYSDMGYVYMLTGDRHKADSCYDLALKYNPYDVKTLNKKGALLFEQKRYSEAKEWLIKAVDLSPGFTIALKNLGNCYGAMNDFEQALFYFKKSLDYDTDDVSRIGVYRKISDIYSILGNESLSGSYAAKANSLESTQKK